MEAPSDTTSMGMLIACVVYCLKAITDGYISLANRANGGGSSISTAEVSKDLAHMQYQIDELKQETSYSRRWRHWMSNAITKLLDKAGIEPDPLPSGEP